MSARLQLESVDVRVGARPLVRGLSLEAGAGEVWALVGPNGAGKTMLLRTMAGLRGVERGRVRWSGRDAADVRVEEAAALRAFLPQSIHDAFGAPVLDVVLLGAHARQGAWAWDGPGEVDRAMAALEAVDARHLADRDVRALSGGERQRVALATLLLQDAPLLFLDEPLAHLDLAHRLAILEHLASLAREHGKCVVLSIHELDLAARCASHAILLEGGGLATAGTVDEVLDEAGVSRAFGHAIRRARVEGRTVFLPA